MGSCFKTRIVVVHFASVSNRGEKTHSAANFAALLVPAILINDGYPDQTAVSATIFMDIVK